MPFVFINLLAITRAALAFAIVRQAGLWLVPRWRSALGHSRYFFSGIAGVTGCDPPVDFGPGLTPALFSVEPGALLAVDS